MAHNNKRKTPPIARIDEVEDFCRIMDAQAFQNNTNAGQIIPYFFISQIQSNGIIFGTQTKTNINKDASVRLPPPKFCDTYSTNNSAVSVSNKKKFGTFNWKICWNKRCQNIFTSFLTQFGVLGAVCVYTVLGALLFLFLEREKDINRIKGIAADIDNSRELLHIHVSGREHETKAKTLQFMDQCINQTLKQYNNLSHEAERDFEIKMLYIDTLVANRSEILQKIITSFDYVTETYCQNNFMHNKATDLNAVSNASLQLFKSEFTFFNITSIDVLSNLSLQSENYINSGEIIAPKSRIKQYNGLFEAIKVTNVTLFNTFSNYTNIWKSCLTRQKATLIELLNAAAFDEVTLQITELRKGITRDHVEKRHANTAAMMVQLQMCRSDIESAFEDENSHELDNRIKHLINSVFYATSEGWTIHHDNVGNISTLWTFTGSILYSITVISTIGYGHIAPRTQEGRIVTIIYAIIGIPLMLLCLSSVGYLMAKLLRTSYKHSCGPIAVYLKTKLKNRNVIKSNNFKLNQHYPKLLAIQKKSISIVDNSYVDNNRITNHCIPTLTENSRYNQTLPYLTYIDDESNTCMYTIYENTDCKNKSVVKQKTQNQFYDTIKRDSKASGSIIYDYFQNSTADDNKELQDNEQDAEEEVIRVPLSLTFAVMFLYIFLGAIAFAHWEDWKFIDSCYFCFITLSTIGFGDLVPGTKESQWTDESKPIFCAAYLIFGLAVLSMCFQLMQQEVINYIGKIIHCIFLKQKKRSQQ